MLALLVCWLLLSLLLSWLLPVLLLLVLLLCWLLLVLLVCWLLLELLVCWLLLVLVLLLVCWLLRVCWLLLVLSLLVVLCGLLLLLCWLFPRPRELLLKRERRVPACLGHCCLLGPQRRLVLRPFDMVCQLLRRGHPRRVAQLAPERAGSVDSRDRGGRAGPGRLELVVGTSFRWKIAVIRAGRRRSVCHRLLRVVREAAGLTVTAPTLGEEPTARGATSGEGLRGGGMLHRRRLE